MSRFAVTLFSQLFFVFTASAQFFSGYYVSDPRLTEFEHLKVHHHHDKHEKYIGDLAVKGFSDYGELWEREARMIVGKKAAFFIREFGESLEIQTVYEFKIAIDGIEEDFILLGFENEKGHPEFIVVEEVYQDQTEEELLELKTFRLIRAHHLDR